MNGFGYGFPKFQVLIPLKVRRLLRIKSGEKMQVIAYDNRVVLFPMHEIGKARGALKGMNSSVQREEEDRRL
jgi:AbrB family looped-hinge helix DNA binding protein